MKRPRGLLAFCILLVLGLIFAGIMFFLDLRGQSTDYLVPSEPLAVPSPPSLPETPPVAEPAPKPPAEGTAFLYGRVLDEAGKPIQADLFITSDLVARKEKTDANGNFRASGLPRADKFAIYIKAEGFIEQTRYDIPPDSELVDFVLVRGATISGEVRDKVTGALLNRISAHPARQGRPLRQPQDFEGGRFRFSGLEAGEYQIWVDAAGYQPRAPKMVQVAEKEDISGVQILLMPYIQVSGVVLSEADRTPVQGARIWVDQIDNEGLVFGHRIGDARDTTDSRGAFLRVLWEPGKHTLLAVHDRFATGSISVEVAEGQKLSGVEILLKSGATLTGTVRDKIGNRVAKVRLVLIPRSEGSTPQKKTVSGEDGRFSFSGLSPSSYKLLASAGGDSDLLPEWVSSLPEAMQDSYFARRRVSTVSVTISTYGEAKSVDVTVDPGEEEPRCRVHGRVLQRGAPVVRCEVTFVRNRDATRRQATTDEEGRYEIRDLPPGKYRVSFGEVSKKVFVPRAPEFPCDLEASSCVLEGIVTDASTGEPLPRAHVMAMLCDGTGGMRTKVTDESGKFRFDDLDEGTYHLSVHRDGYEVADSAEVRISASGPSEPVVIRLEKGAELVVRCLDPQGGPAVGTRVGLHVEWKKQGGGGSREQYEVLGKTGTIKTDGLPAGPAEVWVTSPDYAGVRIPGVEIVKGAPNMHEIRFSLGGTLKFNVSGIDGAPLCGARISLCFPDGSPVYSGYAGLRGAVQRRSSFKTDTDGNCTCERVLGGQIRVRVEAEGHAEVTQDVKVEDAKETSLAISMKKN